MDEKNNGKENELIKENEESKLKEGKVENNEVKKEEEKESRDDLESKKSNLLSEIKILIDLNIKIQNNSFDILKRTDKKIFDKLEPEKFINIFEINSKRLLAYNIFCLYANYNALFTTKHSFPKKFYFKYWLHSLNIKKDE